MKDVKFYLKSPGYVKKGFFWIYGNTVRILPGFVPAMFGLDLLGIVGGYALAGFALLHPTSKAWLKKVDGFFKRGQMEFRRSVWVSDRIRGTLENAGLTMKSGEDVIFPYTEIKADRFNYYLTFQMIEGQTEKQWENKIGAFASALFGDLIASEIKRGTVKVTVQHTEMLGGGVLYKREKGNFLNIGYTPKGVWRWRFDEYPHMLIVGMTGSGKSTFLRNMFVQFDRDWIVDVIDGKYVEFSYLREYGFRVASDKTEFRDFVARAQGEVDRRAKEMEKNCVNHYEKIGYKPYFLVVDEFIFVAESLNAKKQKGQERSEREQLFEDLRDIALRGRACGVFLILILQRPDAAYLPTIIRDNLMAKVVLGQGSETAYEMAFGSERKKLTSLVLGQGYAEIGDFGAFSFPNYEMEQFLDDLKFRRSEKLVDFRGRSAVQIEEGEAL